MRGRVGDGVAGNPVCFVPWVNKVAPARIP